MNSPTLVTPGVDPERQWLKQIALFLGLIFGTIVLAFCFVASSLCITIVLAAFLAILADPVVVRVAKIGLGRVLASGFVVLCFMLLAGILTHVLYNRVSAFADEFPIPTSLFEFQVDLSRCPASMVPAYCTRVKRARPK